MKNFKQYIGEALLIIFSVLFALFINQWFDDHKTQKKAEVAMLSIYKELHRNNGILTRWQTQHSAIKERISDVIDGHNEELKQQLLDKGYLDLGLLTNNESLIDAILTDTAWQSAQSTGIVAEFSFETTQKLTNVFSMQKILTDITVAKILDYYFDASSHQLQNIDQILIQFHLRFIELTGQETLMSTLYSEAMEDIETQLWPKSSKKGVYKERE